MKKGKCCTCSANNKTLCCKQVTSSLTFKSRQTNKSYTIFHEVNCSGGYVIYLLECTTKPNQKIFYAKD